MFKKHNKRKSTAEEKEYYEARKQIPSVSFYETQN
jgi:hypothetical protein